MTEEKETPNAFLAAELDRSKAETFQSCHLLDRSTFDWGNPVQEQGSCSVSASRPSGQEKTPSLATRGF